MNPNRNNELGLAKNNNLSVLPVKYRDTTELYRNNEWGIHFRASKKFTGIHLLVTNSTPFMRISYTLVLIVTTLAINMISYGLVGATRNTGSVTRYLRIQTFTDENSSKKERGFQDVVKKMMQNARVKTARDLVKNDTSFEMIYKKGITPTDLYKALKLEFRMRLAYGFNTWDHFLKTNQYQMWLAYGNFWEDKKTTAFIFGPKFGK